MGVLLLERKSSIQPCMLKSLTDSDCANEAWQDAIFFLLQHGCRRPPVVAVGWCARSAGVRFGQARRRVECSQGNEAVFHEKGNRVLFSLTESYIGHEATGRRIPMRRKNDVCVLRLGGDRARSHQSL